MPRDVAVLIPYRGGCPYRWRALDYILSCYAERHPDWRIILGRLHDGPWVKARAIQDAMQQASEAVLVIADADVWTDGLAEAARSVQEGMAWATPHRTVHRLSEASTALYAAGEDWRDLELAQHAYRGVEGGGIAVVQRAVYEDCPMDPRFEGFGGEDEALGWALRTLHGAPRQGRASLIHLWHPPQQRTTRARGSPENWALRKRYAHAMQNPTQMRTIVQEARDVLDRSVEPASDSCASRTG